MGKKRKVVNAWQEKQKKLGRRAYTVFLEGWIISKIKTRSKAKGMSEADYLNKFLPAMWIKLQK